MLTKCTIPAALAAALAAGLPGCTGCSSGGTGQGNGTPSTQPSDAQRKYPLSSLPTSTVTINSHVFRVWLAREDDPQRPGVLAEGLMFVTPGEIADDQGMLFVFRDEEVRGFWMLNTITPLDIAYAAADGRIVKIWQMPARSLDTFSSGAPAMFALEVKQGTLARLGIKEGDRIEIPSDVRAGSR